MALLAARLASHRAPRLAVQVQISTDLHPQWQAVLDAWKFDVAVLDAQLVLEAPELLGRTGELRQQNPSLCLLAYFSFVDLDRDPSTQESIHTDYVNAVRAMPTGVTKDTTGAPIVLWVSGDDIHDLANVFNSSDVRELAIETIQSEILATHKFDGVFLDWAAGQDSPYVDITWLELQHGNGQFDLDRNGVADSDSSVNAAWVAGLRAVYSTLDDAGVVMVGNGGSVTSGKYNDLISGVMCETFTESLDGAFSTWAKRMRMFAQYDEPCLLMVRTDANTSDEQRQRRLGLASACLLDGVYFCPTNKTTPSGNYVTAPVHDGMYVDDDGVCTDDPSFRHWLGASLLPAFCPDDNAVLTTLLLSGSWSDANAKVWYRPFARGAVAVNPGASPASISIPTGFRRLSGSEDATFNGGTVSGSLTIPARDALILFRTNAAPFVEEQAVGYHYEANVTVLFGDTSDQYFAFFTKRNLDGDQTSGLDNPQVEPSGDVVLNVVSSDGDIQFQANMTDTGDGVVFAYAASGANKSRSGQQMIANVAATIDGASRVRTVFITNELKAGYKLAFDGLDQVEVFDSNARTALEYVFSALCCPASINGNVVTLKSPSGSPLLYVTLGDVRGERTALEFD